MPVLETCRRLVKSLALAAVATALAALVLMARDAEPGLVRTLVALSLFLGLAALLLAGAVGLRFRRARAFYPEKDDS